MFKIIQILPIALFIGLFSIITSCGGGDNKSDKEGKSDTGPHAEYLVLGHIDVPDSIDKALAAEGANIFKEKCTSCHQYDSRLVGPPLGEVAKRRSPEFIMSQILYPEKMLANNDTIKALLDKYSTAMTNQNLTKEQARAVLENLRDVAAGGGK